MFINGKTPCYPKTYNKKDNEKTAKKEKFGEQKETELCEPVELDEDSALTIKKPQKERESPSRKKKVLDKYEQMVTTGTISNEDPVNLIVSSSGQKKKPEET